MQLTLLLCVALVMSACRTTPIALPTNTPRPTAAVPRSASTPQVSPTPFVMPTAPPSPTPLCPDAPRTRLIVHQRGWVLDDDPRPVNVRSGPGLSNRVVGQMPINTVFYVLDGPRCSDGYAWFHIQYAGGEGWVAEGDLTSYYVEPYPPG